MLVTFRELDSYSATTTKTASMDIDRYSLTYGEERAAQVLLESAESEAASIKHFDIFLSHSYSDAKLNRKRILQIKSWLETRHGLKVYIDWINDPLLSRNAVTPATAAKLRLRMSQSDCLFYATSEKSSTSKWMPWELGFKDAHKNQFAQDGRCAILPVSEDYKSSYTGLEFLGLYPFVEESQAKLVLSPQPKIATSKSVDYRSWVMLGINP